MSRDVLLDKLKEKYGEVKGTGDWLRIKCPTCTEHNSKKFRRYVPRVGYTSNCFICGVHLSVPDMLEGFCGVPKFEDSLEEEDNRPVNPLSLVLPYSKAYPLNTLAIDHPAIQFFHKDRLFDLDRYSNEQKIVFVPFDGGQVFINGSVFVTSAERLVFPVYFENKLVGWQMRSVPGTFYADQMRNSQNEQMKDVRYYHLFHKGNYLYNYDNAKKHTRVIVVEGVKKALKFPNAVATWGSGISRKQLQLIQKWDEVIMLLDTDTNDRTQAKAREITECLNDGGKCRAININLAKYSEGAVPISPDEFPADVLQQIVDAEWYEQTKTKK